MAFSPISANSSSFGNFLEPPGVSGTLSNNDQQIIDEVLAGKVASFEVLVRKYQDRLFNALVHVTSDKHEAEEVVQDAMFKAYSKLSTFKGNSQFYTWLYRIAFNLAISKKRKKKPKVSLDEMQSAVGLDPEGDAAPPTQTIELEERAGQVQSALSKLGEEFRTVLVLREMEDCDYETISSMLEIPVGTVRSRLHRARSMMRELLKESIGEPDFS